jgi:hypothetical protein
MVSPQQEHARSDSESAYSRRSRGKSFGNGLRPPPCFFGSASFVASVSIAGSGSVGAGRAGSSKSSCCSSGSLRFSDERPKCRFEFVEFRALMLVVGALEIVQYELLQLHHIIRKRRERHG